MKKKMFLASGIIFAIIGSLMAQDFALGNESLIWNSRVYDFGSIEKSTPVTATFEFENNGQIPVMVVNAKASCGCTVADYTKEPIPVGGTGTVTATYNAAKVGVFSKTVTLTLSGSEEPVVLTLKGNVIE